MSRIHEALRRAEQQEAVPAVESVEEPISLAGMPDSQVIAKAYGDDEATADMGPGLEGALQRCSRPAWHPNRETMLFFDGAEQPAERYQASEQFRTLRSRLYQARRKQPLQKVLIASALPGDGKTFVAANLAQRVIQLRNTAGCNQRPECRCAFHGDNNARRRLPGAFRQVDIGDRKGRFAFQDFAGSRDGLMNIRVSLLPLVRHPAQAQAWAALSSAGVMGLSLRQ